MEIYNLSNLNFGAKLPTIAVLESTTGRVIGNDGINGIRSVILAFPEKYGNKKAPGHKGFRFHAMEIGKLIKEKYPEIATATERINAIVNNNPKINKFELQKEIAPILENLGKELDIVL